MRRGAFRRARANARSSESDGGAALARRASVAVVVKRSRTSLTLVFSEQKTCRDDQR